MSRGDGVNPTTTQCKVNEGENSKKSRASIIAARLQSLGANRGMKVLIAFGSMDYPRFSLADISNPEEDVVINASDETSSILENGVARCMQQFHRRKIKKANKKRTASDPDHSTSRDMTDTGHGEAADGVLVDDDLNEPTMRDKLAGVRAVLACALPWLRCLLLQHASGIVSQESSLLTLNSLYQLIGSRLLSSVLDVLYTGVKSPEGDESGMTVPVICENIDESEEEESEEAMETDETSEDGDDNEAAEEAYGGLSDLEGSVDGMSE
ncbi:hypothetical protein TorRG33x02_147450 [Trema orientale]|uniref:Uncharacterized protein n=1 Tax=Trema orientale TaxID=63057 RepID=A0A2P5EV23_TREOI|nr:hypothetical protein TorRG33x02_147450 [Trema orientale]